MPRRNQNAPKNPEAGARWEKVRLRLGFRERPPFAEAMGVKLSTYVPWETKGRLPLADDFQRAMEALDRRGVQDVLQLAWWLPNGAGEAPFWVENPSDPYQPRPGGPGGAPVPAHPVTLDDAAKLFVLRGRSKIASGETEDFRLSRIVVLLEDWFATQKAPAALVSSTPTRSSSCTSTYPRASSRTSASKPSRSVA